MSYLAPLMTMAAAALSAVVALSGVYLTSVLRRRDDREAQLVRDRREYNALVRERSESTFEKFHAIRVFAYQTVRIEMKLLTGQLPVELYKLSPPKMTDELNTGLRQSRFNIESYLPLTVAAVDHWQDVVNTSLRMRAPIIERAVNAQSTADDVDAYSQQAQLLLSATEAICAAIVSECRAATLPDQVR